MENWEEFIRDNPLIFVKFMFAEYAPAEFDREWAADRMQDLVISARTQVAPKYEETKRALMEARAFIERERQKKEKGNLAIPLSLPAAKGKAKPSGPPDRFLMEKYARTVGISQEIFEDWWALGENSEWTAKDGKIRSAHAALRGYAKWREENPTPAGNGPTEEETLI